jgi:hypothetical protein
MSPQVGDTSKICSGRPGDPSSPFQSPVSRNGAHRASTNELIGFRVFLFKGILPRATRQEKRRCPLLRDDHQESVNPLPYFKLAADQGLASANLADGIILASERWSLCDVLLIYDSLQHSFRVPNVYIERTDSEGVAVSLKHSHC